MVARNPRPLVLVADDDGVMRAMVGTWLGRSGYEVVAAQDGEEALRLAAEHEPDLLLARVRAALRTKAVRDGFVEKAASDGLTGLLNRRELDLRAEAAVALALRHGRALSCLMVDLDHFKQINDRHGHAAGDAVLREAAERISSSSRASDVIGRYGGEEFLLLLPETDARAAVATGDRLRLGLSKAPFHVGGAELTVTASVGVAVWDEPMMTTAALYAAADDALYRAKELGRNRTELFASGPGQTSAYDLLRRRTGRDSV
jgi:two-component system cell cycle response regulator